MTKLTPFEEKRLPDRQPSPDDQSGMRRWKLRRLKEAGRDPYREVRYDRSHTIAEVLRDFESLMGKQVRIGGRAIARREHGKACFLDLADQDGRIQVYANVNTLGEEQFEQLKSADLGDILGVEGEVFRTRTGQESIKAAACTLLTKSLEPLPEKWHGLSDIELRYRRRYLDLMVSPEVRERFKLRSEVVSQMRRFLEDECGFTEFETPVLEPVCGGATAEPFITRWEALDDDFYLRIAIELRLKRLIVGGYEKVYEIGRIFRNEGVDTQHNPEFTMLELYWAYVDYNDIMQLTEDLVVHICDKCMGTREIDVGDRRLSFKPPFSRVQFENLMREHAGVSVQDLPDRKSAAAHAKKLGVEFSKDAGYEKIIDRIWTEKVEPQLIQPTFVLDYPVAVSPLAKRIPDRPHLAYRFELFANSVELANAFSELNDPLEQRARMEEQIARATEGYRELDEDFLLALEYGMPPTGGLGVGVERLLMALLGEPSIREVMLFPQLRKQ
jgi:lysyl-tRNA synthetase class 2